MGKQWAHPHRSFTASEECHCSHWLPSDDSKWQWKILPVCGKIRRIIYKWMMFYCDVTLLEECHQLWYRARQSGPPTTRPLIPVPTFSAGLPSMSSCHPKNDRSHQGLPGILGDYWLLHMASSSTVFSLEAIAVGEIHNAWSYGIWWPFCSGCLEQDGKWWVLYPQ